MRSVIQTQKYGEIVFDESYWTGKKTVTVGGVQLKKVSKYRQVLCVTHLAQIAGFGNEHFLISKNTDNGRAYTNVVPLSYDERIKEIARIMSGSEITDSLYNSAKELLERKVDYENL